MGEAAAPEAVGRTGSLPRREKRISTQRQSVELSSAAQHLVDNFSGLTGFFMHRRESEGNAHIAVGLPKESIFPPSFTRDDLKPKGIDRLVIHPDSRGKSVYEVFIIFCVLYTAIVEPVKVAYVTDIGQEMDDFLDIIFCLDILIQFFSGFHDSGGTRFAVMKLRIVAREYVKTWFSIDLIAAIPFDRLVPSSDGSVMVRIPGLIKTVRLLKLRRIMKKWNNLSYGPLLKVLTILTMWLLIGHWLSCGFFMIGWYGCSWNEETWVTVYMTQLKADCKNGSIPDPSLVTPAGSNYRFYNQMTLLGLHLRVLFWAIATMSSMGYANAPVPIADIDYAYAIMTQVVGACLAAAIFSNIAQMINKGDAAGARYQAQLDQIREFSKVHRLKRSVAQKLQYYNELVFSVSRGFNLQQIAEKFPVTVQEDIAFNQHELAIRRLPMFTMVDCDESFFRALSRVLHVQVLLDRDEVFRANDIGDKMYFIKTGYIQITDADNEIVFVTLGPGGYFGEFAILDTHGSRRTASAIALSDCILHTLSAQDFQTVSRRFGIDMQRMRQKANEVRETQLRENNEIAELHRRISGELAYGKHISDEVQEKRSETVNRWKLASASALARQRAATDADLEAGESCSSNGESGGSNERKRPTAACDNEEINRNSAAAYPLQV